jgi:hypothetical protein
MCSRHPDTQPIHNPGGRVSLALRSDISSDATFGGLGDCYRYRLTRRWQSGPSVLIVMMNPSVADMRADDPTVSKVTRMARRWRGGQFGCLMVGNAFAYRATDQDRLAEVEDPIGPDNNWHLLDMAAGADLVVFAYGLPKIATLRARGPAVVRFLADAGIMPHVLRMGRGAPWHPLYLPDATEPIAWRC